jgi:tetratricopeptide (TPR) repeat protein
MDHKRHELTPDPEGAARDSQIEALLVAGLDHYFARRYDEAIHVWTRVLFLDRSHARARAYIERARTALAERQRRAEELLATGHSLIDQGRTEAARDILAEAVATTGDDERASALRLRLERVERAQGGVADAGPVAVFAAASVPAWARRWSTPATVALVAGAGVLLIGVMAVGTVRGLLGLPAGRSEFTMTGGAAPAPVLSSADVALVRARTLYGRGRLAEALGILDRIGPGSPARAAADQLRIEIQRLLLASGRESSRTPAGSGSRVP